MSSFANNLIKTVSSNDMVDLIKKQKIVTYVNFGFCVTIYPAHVKREE